MCNLGSSDIHSRHGLHIVPLFALLFSGCWTLGQDGYWEDNAAFLHVEVGTRNSTKVWGQSCCKMTSGHESWWPVVKAAATAASAQILPCNLLKAWWATNILSMWEKIANSKMNVFKKSHLWLHDYELCRNLTTYPKIWHSTKFRCTARTLKMEAVAATDLNLLDHPFPGRLGVDVQFIPNPMFDFWLVPLSMVEQFGCCNIKGANFWFFLSSFLGIHSPSKAWN